MNAGSNPGPPMVLVIGRCDGSPSRSEKVADRNRALSYRLREGGFIAENIDVNDAGQLRAALRDARPDMAFCSFFRFPGYSGGDRYLQDACSESGVVWIGSPIEAMELALSKPSMKSHWRLAGIRTPDWLVVAKASDGSLEGIERLERARDFPYIVKPANDGNSRGIRNTSVVWSSLELYSLASWVAENYGAALVERFVSGGQDSREFTVAMIGNGARAIVSPVEVVKPGDGSLVVTEDDKDRDSARAVPIGNGRLRERVARLARDAFLSAGARDYARCDILLHEGTLYAIELNGQPHIPDSWFGACARETGLDELQYVNAIALAAISRSLKEGRAFVSAPRGLERLMPDRVLERLTA
jgi:D-alanine-D-alanine ligase